MLFDLLLEVSDTATILVPDSHVHHLFYVDCHCLFSLVARVAVRSSYDLATRKILVKILVQERTFEDREISLVLVRHANLVCVMVSFHHDLGLAIRKVS